MLPFIFLIFAIAFFALGFFARKTNNAKLLKRIVPLKEGESEEEYLKRASGFAMEIAIVAALVILYITKSGEPQLI